MEKICIKIVKKLEKQNTTLAFMESCTGGFLTNSITNIPGASNIVKVSLVTYSSEYKLKFGVDKNVLDNYTVYSNQTSMEMARNVSKFANSDIGVGITGELGNTINKKPKVYYTIYFAENNKYINKIIEVTGNERKEMKKKVAEKVLEDLLESI